MTRILIIFILSLTACSSAPYNPSVFDYQIDEGILNNPEFKHLVIASINLGKPSRMHLKKSENHIDDKVAHYLRQNGFSVSSSRLFESRWEKATHKYGELYNPTTGKLSKFFQSALAETIEDLTKNANIDAVVFTDLIERDIQFSGGMNHIARWDGVSRKPSLQGPGAGVPADFNWGQNVKAVSLWVSIYDGSLKRVFTSIGGIEVTEAIDMKAANPSFIRRRHVLNKDSQIEEGIQLAFHPLIVMKKYPSKER